MPNKVTWIGIIVFWNRKEDTLLYHIFKLIILLFGSIMMFDSGMFLPSFDTDYICDNTGLNADYKCSNVSKHKWLECVLEDVRVKWCQFCVFLGPVFSRLSHCIAALFLRGESVLMGNSLSRCWIRSPVGRWWPNVKGLRRWEFLSLV